MKYSLAGKRVWVAGHTGMVGSAITRRLESENCQVITATRAEADLTVRADVDRFLLHNSPDAVFCAAAKVGGIVANSTYPADFIFDNISIAANIIDGSYRNGVDKLLFLGSSCIYPRDARQPLSEDALLTGPLEPTNEPYAIAKIAAIKLAQSYRDQYGCDFISVMPTNLYGPNDNYDLINSHVLPALVRKVCEAKHGNAESVIVWGSGRPLREFLHVDDCADACVYIMCNYSSREIVNIGTGLDISILRLAELICEVAEYKGLIIFDSSKPDGTPRKVLDTRRLNSLGWEPSISLLQGVKQVYCEFEIGHLANH